MTHRVQVLADGVLEDARPHGPGFRFVCEGRPRRVLGALVNGRYVPREPPVSLDPGDVFDVSAEDVARATEKLRPVQRCRQTGLQLLHAFVDLSTHLPDRLHPDSPLRVVAPGLLMDAPVETPAAWVDRTYSLHVGPQRSYERELAVRVGAGAVVLRAARPLGFAPSGHLLLRCAAIVVPPDR